MGTAPEPRGRSRAPDAADGQREGLGRQQRSIFDVESVVSLGAQIGLDAAELREALASGRYKEAVDADCREASGLGCTGVPFVVVNRKVGVAGAQSVDTLVRALRSV